MLPAHCLVHRLTFFWLCYTAQTQLPGGDTAHRGLDPLGAVSKQSRQSPCRHACGQFDWRQFPFEVSSQVSQADNREICPYTLILSLHGDTNSQSLGFSWVSSLAQSSWRRYSCHFEMCQNDSLTIQNSQLGNSLASSEHKN